MEEKEYRAHIETCFRKIQVAFDRVDPDLAEFELSQGAVTILFQDRSRCILSTQPSVRQIWLANASQGVAYHFNYDLGSQKWVDDKGKGVTLLSYLEALVSEKTGIRLGLA